MTETPKTQQIVIEVTDETMEQVAFLAAQEGMSVAEIAHKLLAEEAEAQAGLTRGPYLRKYMHR